MAKSRADEMTIVEHLVEFRKRLIAVVLCYIIVFIVAFVFAGELYQILTASLHQKLLVLGPNDILWTCFEGEGGACSLCLHPS